MRQPVVVWIEIWIAPEAIVCKRGDFNRPNTSDTKNPDIFDDVPDSLKNTYRIYSHWHTK